MKRFLSDNTLRVVGGSAQEANQTERLGPNGRNRHLVDFSIRGTIDKAFALELSGL